MESSTTSIISTAAEYGSSSSSDEDHILDDIVRALDSWTQRISHWKQICRGTQTSKEALLIVYKNKFWKDL